MENHRRAILVGLRISIGPCVRKLDGERVGRAKWFGYPLNGRACLEPYRDQPEPTNLLILNCENETTSIDFLHRVGRAGRPGY